MEKAEAKRVIILLDVSGSMEHKLQRACGGITSALHVLMQNAGSTREIRYTLWTFSDYRACVVADALLCSDTVIAPVEVQNRTALYDALVDTLLDPPPLESSVTLVLATDGADTASRKHTAEDARVAVQRAIRERGVRFVVVVEGAEVTECCRAIGLVEDDDGQSVSLHTVADGEDLGQSLESDRFALSLSQAVLSAAAVDGESPATKKSKVF